MVAPPKIATKIAIKICVLATFLWAIYSQITCAIVTIISAAVAKKKYHISYRYQKTQSLEANH